MKTVKAPRNDDFSIKVVAIGQELWKALIFNFSRYLTENTIPSREKSKTFLLDKKSDLKNYRPICSYIYSLLTRIIINRQKSLS